MHHDESRKLVYRAPPVTGPSVSYPCSPLALAAAHGSTLQRGRRTELWPYSQCTPLTRNTLCSKEKLAGGADKLQEGLLKSKMSFEHKLGLGHQPNVIPTGTPDIKGDPRPIEIGWHPVAGFAGKWFSEKTGLGRLITARTNKCPDPTQHWAYVSCSDYSVPGARDGRLTLRRRWQGHRWRLLPRALDGRVFKHHLHQREARPI